MALRIMQGKVWPYLLVKPVLPVGIVFLSLAEHSLLYKPQLISADCLKFSCAKKQSVLQQFLDFLPSTAWPTALQDSLTVTL